MPKKKAILDSNLLDVVQLISEDEVSSEMGEAFASFMLNPTVVWAKFILTDDRKNANSQRIPHGEFMNLIKSGIHMPVKMALGEIKPGHDDSKPLGVITHLKEVETPEGVKALVALAALWGEERPSDVEYIKKRFKENLPVDVSWEIFYEDSVYNEEEGSEDLLGTVLRAATVVGMPAYGGRTSFLSVAAKKWSKAYIENLSDNRFLYVSESGERMFPIADEDGIVDKAKIHEALAELEESNLPEDVINEKKEVLKGLIAKFESGASIQEVSTEFVGEPINNLEDNKVKPEELQAEVEELKAKLSEKVASLEEKEAALAAANASIEELKAKTEELQNELVPLKEKEAAQAALEAQAARLEEVKQLFVEAGIEKEDEYFEANSEKLIGLDEGALDFMIQELKAFAEENKVASASKTKIPALSGEGVEPMSIKDLAEQLRTRNAK